MRVTISPVLSGLKAIIVGMLEVQILSTRELADLPLSTGPEALRRVGSQRPVGAGRSLSQANVKL